MLENRVFSAMKRAALAIDKAVETAAISAMALMTLIVILQVFTRKLGNFVFFWSEEITLLLLVWFSFIGIAVGFREKLHLAMDAFTNLFPAKFNRMLNYVIGLSILLFGVYLIYYGGRLTVLMSPNKMSATEWSSAVQYIVMPITGVLICFYASLQIFGVNTARQAHLDEELTPK